MSLSDREKKIIMYSIIGFLFLVSVILLITFVLKSSDKGVDSNNVQWYPDSNGKFSANVKAKDVESFVKNIGSIIKHGPEFDNSISKTPICDKQDTDRQLLADYLSRVYNGTKLQDILRLTYKQMESILLSSEWIYTVPNFPEDVKRFIANRRRYVLSELPDCNNYKGQQECIEMSGGTCYYKEYTNECVRSYPKNVNNKYGDLYSYAPYYATNSQLSPWRNGSPITSVMSNWNADRPESYLFQTQMKRGQWWGNMMFTDPSRSTLRRGMMNSPQNNKKSFHTMFGYGGVPCNVLFEGGILPVDSAFAPPGSIHNPLGTPVSCVESGDNASSKSCVYPADRNGKKISNDKVSKNKMKNVYSYFSPGSGMFFDSGNCTYMFNYVDGLLNVPSEFYDPDRKGFNYNHSDLISKRLPNGNPDHIVGISKLLIWLLSMVFYETQPYETAIEAEKNDSWSELTGWDLPYATDWKKAKQQFEEQKFKNKGYLPIFNVKLPNEVDDILKSRAEEKFHGAGLGLGGKINPMDKQGPPRGIASARSLVSQVAALMGVWVDKNDKTKSNRSVGEKNSWGLFTTNGKPKSVDCPFIDKRKYVMGWVNGRWYGYPPDNKFDMQTSLDRIKDTDYDKNNIRKCMNKIGAKYIPRGSEKRTNGNMFTKGGKDGVKGKQELSDEKWVDGYFMPTPDNPLIYYGLPDPKTGKRSEIYRTWYGKTIKMDYNTAAELVGVMYSCGDTGWETSTVSWPFGSFFAYSEDLGAGKKIIGGGATEMFGSTTLHYTMTPTSLSKSQLVSPAYDYEILITIKDKGIQTYDCFCSKYMKSVNLLYKDGEHLGEYAAPGKGALGGWFPTEAGVPYDGSNGMSNWTTLYTADEYNKDPEKALASGTESLGYNCVDEKTGKVPDSKKHDCWFGSFDPTKKNILTGKTNILNTDDFNSVCK